MKATEWRISLLVFVVGALALGAAPGVRGDDDDDPSGRVARLNYMRGSISFRPASVDDWSEANSNYPLTTGDHLWTDRDARGEVHMGGSVVRLGSETAFSLLNLDDRTAQMRVTDGTISVRVNDLDEDEVVEVDTPNAAISLLRPGSYRIDVGQDGEETTVTVRGGQVEVTAGGSAFTVRSDESAVVSGTDSPSYDVRDARRSDEWEEWCDDRDRREEQSASSKYVSREMVGYSDLDDNGSWNQESEYGAVWYPTRVDSGWAPYRQGRWSWVYPWGWTWVDDSSWGFAPFHYGRWAQVRGRWGWCPGTIVARPVYAPALVAFVGGNSWGASISISDGVGWFPLGPREAYVPPYRHSTRYVQNVNITQVNVTNVNITNVTYVNRNVRGAVTAVPRSQFVGGKSFGRTAVVVPTASIRSAPIGNAQFVADIRPRQESIVGVGRGVNVAKPPVKVSERRVVVRVAPPPTPPRFPDQGKPRTEERRSNPLVRSAVPKTGDPITLKPVRSGIVKAQPVTPREVETRRPTSGETGGRPAGTNRNEPGDKPGDRPKTDRNERPTPKPLPTPRGEPGDQTNDRRKTDRNERPTPKPQPTPRVDPEDQTNDRRKTDRNERPTPKPQPTPRVEPERPTPKPHPTPRVEPEDQTNDRHKTDRTERPTPKPQPTPRVEPEDRSNDRLKNERERPTPRPDREEQVKPRREEERPHPTPKPEATPRPTPRPEPKPTPKPTPKPSPTPK